MVCERCLDFGVVNRGVGMGWGGAGPPLMQSRLKYIYIYLRYSRDLWDSDSGVLLYNYMILNISWKFLILIIISICNVTVYLIIIVYCQTFGIACLKLGCGSAPQSPGCSYSPGKVVSKSVIHIVLIHFCVDCFRRRRR